MTTCVMKRFTCLGHKVFGSHDQTIDGWLRGFGNVYKLTRIFKRTKP